MCSDRCVTCVPVHTPPWSGLVKFLRIPRSRTRASGAVQGDRTTKFSNWLLADSKVVYQRASGNGECSDSGDAWSKPDGEDGHPNSNGCEECRYQRIRKTHYPQFLPALAAAEYE